MKTILTIKEVLPGHYWTKGKHWAKAIESVDTARQNGYAFVGEFVPDDRPVELEVGTMLLDFRTEGSRKHPEAAVCLARVTADGVETLESWRVDMEGWALRIRDKVAETLTAALNSNSERERIEAEIVSLEARIAELRAKLEDLPR